MEYYFPKAYGEVLVVAKEPDNQEVNKGQLKDDGNIMDFESSAHFTGKNYDVSFNNGIPSY